MKNSYLKDSFKKILKTAKDPPYEVKNNNKFGSILRLSLKVMQFAYEFKDKPITDPHTYQLYVNLLKNYKYFNCAR